MWKPMGDNTGQCCNSLESTGHHIMRNPKRWPPPKAAATFLGGRPKAAPHYAVICGFQRGAALASAVPHWFPHVQFKWVAWSSVAASQAQELMGHCHIYIYIYISGVSDFRNSQNWRKASIIAHLSNIFTTRLEAQGGPVWRMISIEFSKY